MTAYATEADKFMLDNATQMHTAGLFWSAYFSTATVE